MTETTHYQTDLAVIKHLHEQNTMLLTWSGFQSHENLTKAMNTAFDLIVKENLNFWISDHRQLEVLTKESQQWINEQFIPKLLTTSPVKKVAIIVGEKIFTNMAMDNIKKAADQANLPVQYFPDAAAAFGWFENTESVAA